MHDAQPHDVYVDEHGKLWRVAGAFGEPSVVLREIESKTPESPVGITAGVSGAVFNGFKRIYRHDARDMLDKRQGSCQQPVKPWAS